MCIAAHRATVFRGADKFRVLISQHWVGISDSFTLQPIRLLETIRLVGYNNNNNNLLYTYVPETNYVPREYSVAAILLLLFMLLISLLPVLNLLYSYISTFRSMCAVPNMAVFCSSLTSCFPGMLLTYFLNDFEIVPFAPIVTGITFVFTFHMRCISIMCIIIIITFIFCFSFVYLNIPIPVAVRSKA